MRSFSRILLIVMALFVFQSRATVTIQENVSWHGTTCYKITTPWATLYYQNGSGQSGFMSVIDDAGNDWMQAGFGATGGGARGFPNATDSNFGHPNRSGATNAIIGAKSGDHVIIESKSSTMTFRYHFFDTHGAIEVLKANEKYCFLWEGLVGGTIRADDFFYTSDGKKHTHSGNWGDNVFTDIKDEWLYFGNPALSKMMLIGKYPDDNYADENWSNLNDPSIVFELYSFGRDSKNKFSRSLTGTSNYFVYSMIPKSKSHEEIKSMIASLFAKPYEPLNAKPDTSLTIKDAPSSIGIDQTIELTATVKPEIGKISWAGANGAIVTDNGNGKASVKAKEGSTKITVIASSGKFADTVTMVVLDPKSINLKINCGGTATGDWISDKDYVASPAGEAYNFGSTARTSDVKDPAPSEVYKTCRHLDHSYSISVPNGVYLVRIHFTDPTGDTKRKMNYTIEGKNVLSDLNVGSEAEGFGNALIKEFTVEVKDGNGLQISATKGSGDDVFEAGIEILGSQQTATIYRQINSAKSVHNQMRLVGRTIMFSPSKIENTNVSIFRPNGVRVAKLSLSKQGTKWTAPSKGVYVVKFMNMGAIQQQSIQIIP